MMLPIASILHTWKGQQYPIYDHTVISVWMQVSRMKYTMRGKIDIDEYRNIQEEKIYYVYHLI